MLIRRNTGEVQNSMILTLIGAVIFLVLALYLTGFLSAEAEESDYLAATSEATQSLRESEDARDVSIGLDLQSQEALDLYNQGRPASQRIDVDSLYSVEPGPIYETPARSYRLSSEETLRDRYSGTEISDPLESFLDEGEVRVDETVKIIARQYTYVFEDDRGNITITHAKWVFSFDDTRSSGTLDGSVAFIIPKSVAESALENIRSPSTFEILHDDPLIAFDIPQRQVEEETISIEYYIEGSVVDQIEDIEPVILEKDIVENSSPTPSQVPRASDGNLIMVIVLVLLMLVVVIYVQYQHRHHH